MSKPKVEFRPEIFHSKVVTKFKGAFNSCKLSVKPKLTRNQAFARTIQGTGSVFEKGG